MNTGEIKGIPSTHAVKVINRQLPSKEYILEFQLLHDSYEDEYLRLCWDMINAYSDSNSPVKAFIQRYLSWQKLLQYKNDKIMSFQSQKGLLGELLFLNKCIDCLGHNEAINAWQGPDGSDQDFLFETSWTEVKTVALASDCVRISSLEQLKQEQTGELHVFFLEKAVKSKGNYNLVSVINSIRDRLDEYPECKDLFEMKIYKYGYRDKDSDEYKDNFFRLSEERSYIVDESFPKLTSKNVNPAVTACTYELS